MKPLELWQRYREGLTRAFWETVIAGCILNVFQGLFGTYLGMVSSFSLTGFALIAVFYIPVRAYFFERGGKNETK